MTEQTPDRRPDHDATAPAGDPLDALVDRWLTLPEIAELLDVDVMRVRQLVRDGRLVAVRHGEGEGHGVLRVPAGELWESPESGRLEPVPALQGTATLLADAGLTPRETIEWLFTDEPALGARPMDALRSGQRAAVRRVAQTVS